MSGKTYLPSVGFSSFVITCILAAIFFIWALSPLNYEKAAQDERQGQSLYRNGDIQQAFVKFLKAAEIDDQAPIRSRRYLSVAKASSNYADELKYYQLALKYNPENGDAKIGIEQLERPIVYRERYPDGWSKGRQGRAIIHSQGSRHKVNFFTVGAEIPDRELEIMIDGKPYLSMKIIAGKHYEEVLDLPPGRHDLLFSISESINLKAMGIGNDSRDLGLNYVISDVEKADN